MDVQTPATPSATLKPSARLRPARSRSALPPLVPDPFPGEPWSIREALRSYRRPITVEELAVILRFTTQVIYARVRQGRIPSVRLPGNRSVYFEPAALVNWYDREQRRLSPASRPAPATRTSKAAASTPPPGSTD